jgi:nucleotide-binding universal stress UspA family protein
MYRRILVPTDGSTLSRKAVKAAIAFAKACGATVTLLHVTRQHQVFLDESFVVPVTTSPSLRKEFKRQVAVLARELLDRSCRMASAAGIECDAVAVAGDSVHEAILDQARKYRCDLIIMASHGRRGLMRALLGSETAKVLVHGRIPVLVVR